MELKQIGIFKHLYDSIQESDFDLKKEQKFLDMACAMERIMKTKFFKNEKHKSDYLCSEFYDLHLFHPGIWKAVYEGKFEEFSIIFNMFKFDTKEKIQSELKNYYQNLENNFNDGKKKIENEIKNNPELFNKSSILINICKNNNNNNEENQITNNPSNITCVHQEYYSGNDIKNIINLKSEELEKKLINYYTSKGFDFTEIGGLILYFQRNK